MLFDVLAGLFWSLTYILSIVYSIKYKANGIPIFCICSNFGWETIALIQSIFVWKSFSPAVMVHIAWFILDAVIVMLYLLYESKWNENFGKKTAFVLYYAFTLILFTVAFNNGGMLLSSFIIDLIMAVVFIFFAFRKEMIFSLLSITIGITKLIGDAFAWLCYKFDSTVNLIGIMALIFNSAYIIVLSHKYFKNKKNKNRQEDEK